MSNRLIGIALLLCTASAPLRAQARDTLPHRPLFTWNDALLGAVFVGGTFAMFPVDKHYAEQLQQPDRQDSRFYKDAATFFNTTAQPGSVVIGATLYAYGR